MRGALRTNRKTAPAAAGEARLIDPLRRLSRRESLAMYQAAATATQCAAALGQRGKNPVTEVLAGAGAVEEWAHFPPGDVIDAYTHCQYYYHAHAQNERAAGEHGHFHLFVRPKELAPGLAPSSSASSADENPAGFAHLVGISTDACGRLIRLFTTNRWVTGEVWYGADALIGMLDRFEITAPGPSLDLNRWLTAIVRLFRPQIADLIRARDVAVQEHRAARPGCDVLEDRELAIASQMPVDFLQQIQALERVLGAAAPGTGSNRNGGVQ